MAKCQNLFKACLVWRLWVLISKCFQSMNLWRWALGCCQSSTSIPHLTTRYKKCARWSFQNPFLMQPTWGQAVQLALLQSRPCCQIHAVTDWMATHLSHRLPTGRTMDCWATSDPRPLFPAFTLCQTQSDQLLGFSTRGIPNRLGTNGHGHLSQGD